MSTKSRGKGHGINRAGLVVLRSECRQNMGGGGALRREKDKAMLENW